MKKYRVLFLLLLTVFHFSIWAQDLRPIGRDLSAILEGIGNEAVPYLQQNALAGEGIGRASMGEEARFSFAFSAGTIFTPGLLTFVDEDNSNFELLNVYGLVQDAMGEASDQVTKIYDSIRSRFYYPNLRLAVGIKIPYDFEVIGTFSLFPQALTNVVVNLADLEGLELSRMNLGLRVRKVLLYDKDGFPAVSVGGGYTYANFHAGYLLPEFTQAFSGYDLYLGGNINLDTRVHTAGLDFSISKKLLIFHPFLTVSSWYQWSKYEALIENFVAEFRDSAGEVIVDAEEQNIIPGSTLTMNDLNVLLGAGIEIALGKFMLVPNASFNLFTQSFNANLGMRLQF